MTSSRHWRKANRRGDRAETQSAWAIDAEPISEQRGASAPGTENGHDDRPPSGIDPCPERLKTARQVSAPTVALAKSRRAAPVTVTSAASLSPGRRAALRDSKGMSAQPSSPSQVPRTNQTSAAAREGTAAKVAAQAIAALPKQEFTADELHVGDILGAQIHAQAPRLVTVTAKPDIRHVQVAWVRNGRWKTALIKPVDVIGVLVSHDVGDAARRPLPGAPVDAVGIDGIAVVVSYTPDGAVDVLDVSTMLIHRMPARTVRFVPELVRRKFRPVPMPGRIPSGASRTSSALAYQALSGPLARVRRTSSPWPASPAVPRRSSPDDDGVLVGARVRFAIGDRVRTGVVQRLVGENRVLVEFAPDSGIPVRRTLMRHRVKAMQDGNPPTESQESQPKSHSTTRTARPD